MTFIASLDPVSLVVTPVIAALVAILFTGKITAALNRRAAARKLRSRLTRATAVGDGGELTQWWYATDDQLHELGTRLTALGDDAATLDGGAAQAFWHAAQMVPVFQRCKVNYDRAARDVAPALNKAQLHPDIYTPERLKEVVGAAIECRDDALDAVAHIYRDLLAADHRLAAVSRWVRIVDRSAELPAPSPFVAALAYAERYLQGAAQWIEPDLDHQEILRVYSIAAQVPPDSGIREIDDALPRIRLPGTGDVIDRLPGRTQRRPGS